MPALILEEAPEEASGGFSQPPQQAEKPATQLDNVLLALVKVCALFVCVCVGGGETAAQSEWDLSHISHSLQAVCSPSCIVAGCAAGWPLLGCWCSAWRASVALPV
jgi:hypothetical protein